MSRAERRRDARAARTARSGPSREAIDPGSRFARRKAADGRDPVTTYTYKNYEYRAGIMKAYEWDKPLQSSTAPDIVAFRSWLLSPR